MKKNIKTIIVCCISCIIILIALPVYIIARSTLNKGVYLLYNEKYHTLLIANSESAKYIRKITLDLHRDTLFVNVYKKVIFIKPTSIINSSVTEWKIKLQQNVRFVKLGDKITPLSEMKKYPDKDLLETYYPAIEVFPQKFPYICQ